MEKSASQRTVPLVCATLVLLTLAVYWPVRDNGFLLYDDGDYVYENQHVLTGIMSENVRWAFTTNHASNWHPLTWLSLMLDCQLFGAKPGAIHLVNVLFHTANSVLLFLLLRRLALGVWPSAFVAALFAWHPLHVQSVAWIAERKDVLSALFWLLTTWAYLRQIERPTWQRRVVTLTLFALGLMAKPMLVTLPCTLVLLDLWPLRRWSGGKPARADAAAQGGLTLPTLIREKWAFFILAAVSSVVTFLVQRERGVQALSVIPLGERFSNAAIAYVRYLRKMTWPSDLAVFDPYYRNWQAWQVLGAALLLVAVTAFAVRLFRSRPYLLVGWLWFLGTLVPVIGIVQVGGQSMADRYTYIPLIGVFVMIALAGAEIAATGRLARWTVAICAAGVVVACLARTKAEVCFWRDDIAIFSRALAVTRENALAHHNLGFALAKRGQQEAAIAHYRESIKFNPTVADVYNNLGNALAAQGKFVEAIDQYREAQRRGLTNPEVMNNLGKALTSARRFSEAMDQFQAALRIRSGYTVVKKSLAKVFVELGRFPEAVTAFTEYLREYPEDWIALHGRGQALLRLGRTAEAAADFETTVRLRPDYTEAQSNLGAALGTLQKYPEAAEAYRRTLRLNPFYPDAHFNLAAILVAQRKYAEAIPHLAEAVRLKSDDTQARLLFATTCANAGQTEEALRQYREALRLKPDLPQALNSLARILATHAETRFRSGPEAVGLAERACALTQNKSGAALDTLAASYAEAGRFAEALAMQEKAIAAVKTASTTNDLPAMLERLELYRAGKPFHQKL